MKVLIADDHVVVRAGIKQIILGAYPNAKVDEAGTYGLVASKLEADPAWDLVILDMSMPGGNGLDLLQHIKQTNEKIPVVVLSMYSEDQFGVRALKCGASGYLTKESAQTELINAVTAALDGKRYVTPSLAQKLNAVGDDNENSLTPWNSLSEREMYVMRALYEGLAINEIAARLEISIKTVSTYRQRVLKKLKLNTNSELVQYVIRNQLFGSDQIAAGESPKQP